MICIFERLGDEVLWRYNWNDGVSQIYMNGYGGYLAVDAELYDTGIALHTDTRAKIKLQVLNWLHDSGEGQKWIEESRN